MSSCKEKNEWINVYYDLAANLYWKFYDSIKYTHTQKERWFMKLKRTYTPIKKIQINEKAKVKIAISHDFEQMKLNNIILGLHQNSVE